MVFDPCKPQDEISAQTRNSEPAPDQIVENHKPWATYPSRSAAAERKDTGGIWGRTSALLCPQL